MLNKRLTIEERKKIYNFIHEGYSCSLIAKKLNRSKNAIVKEIRINGGRTHYDHNKAQMSSNIRNENRIKKIGIVTKINAAKDGARRKYLHYRVNEIENKLQNIFDQLKILTGYIYDNIKN